MISVMFCETNCSYVTQRMRLGRLVAGIGVLPARVGVSGTADAAVEELLPGLERLAGPDPEAGRGADHQTHEVLEHEHGVVGRRLAGPAALAGPRRLPVVPQVLLIHVARDHDGGRHGVEEGEHADADHQPLQLVRLPAALLLDHVADAEEGDEAGQEERGPDDEVHHQRRDHESAEVGHRLVAHVADSGHGVAVHGGHGQDSDALHRGDQPRCQVEVLGVAADQSHRMKNY